MDLLLQVSEKELEEFPEPPVDHTDQDKPDRTSTGWTQSSNISHQLQTQTQTSTASKASKVLTASVVSSPGMESLQCDLQCDQYLATGDLQHDQICDQVPCTHSYVWRSNVTSHLPIFLHCWHYRWNPAWRHFPRPSLQKF